MFVFFGANDSVVPTGRNMIPLTCTLREILDFLTDVWILKKNLRRAEISIYTIIIFLLFNCDWFTLILKQEVLFKMYAKNSEVQKNE